MKYRVIIQPSAHKELRTSIAWGCEKWGVEQAQKWAQGIRKAIASLATFPERYGLAPEQEEPSHEVRQMIFQRYRVLFPIGEKAVHVLHVRGSYTGGVNDETEDTKE